MSDHNRADRITSDGDCAFLTNYFIPEYRNAPHYMKTVRALWTALCVHHGMDALLARYGAWIYNVTREPSIYYAEAH